MFFKKRWLLLLVFLINPIFKFFKKKQIKQKNKYLISSELLVWNPSQDPKSPNYAFSSGAHEYIKIHKPLIVAVISSREEHDAIKALLGDVFVCSKKSSRVVMAKHLGVQFVGKLNRDEMEPGVVLVNSVAEL